MILVMIMIIMNCVGGDLMRKREGTYEEVAIQELFRKYRFLERLVYANGIITLSLCILVLLMMSS